VGFVIDVPDPQDLIGLPKEEILHLWRFHMPITEQDVDPASVTAATPGSGSGEFTPTPLWNQPETSYLE
jgi:hypothetical protein